jgi:hypothetical protein
MMAKAAHRGLGPNSAHWPGFPFSFFSEIHLNYFKYFSELTKFVETLKNAK